MQTAYINLIKYALANDCTVSVWDGEEWQVKRSTSQQAIIDAVKSVEEASLRIRNAAGEVVGNVLVMAYGLEPDETVVDYGVNTWMQAWEAHYAA